MDFSWKKLVGSRNFILIVCCIWGLFLVSQALSTPLHIDECYYWLFGQNLDWGYFDHPPGVALFIYLSDLVLSGKLGVRIVTILSQIGGILILYRMVDNPAKKNGRFFLTFFLFFICLPLNHIYGIITTPDVPLLLAASLFFLSYKEFLKKNNLLWTVMWGVTMAAMLYSKYHGALVIFFVLCSNPRLFLNYRTYLAGAIGIALFIPHLKWQYDHDFVSFVYHLKERVVIYKRFYPLEYILNVILVFNPLFIGFLVRLLKKFRRNNFERSLYFTLVGMVGFFGLQSFRVHIQPQWIVLVYIPFIILFFNNIQEKDHKSIRNKFYILAPFLIALHIFMSIDLLPHDLGLHGKKEFVQEIQNDANGKPVMFYGSYSHASIYSWYSDQKVTHSYNGPTKRKNQFNIWTKDSIFHFQDVYLVGTYINKPGGKVYSEGFTGVEIEYKPLDNVEIKVKKLEFTSDSIRSTIAIENPYKSALNFTDSNRLAVYYLSIENENRGRHVFVEADFTVEPFSTKEIELIWVKPKSKIDQLGFSVSGLEFPFAPVYHRYKPIDMDKTNE